MTRAAATQEREKRLRRTGLSVGRKRATVIEASRLSLERPVCRLARRVGARGAHMEGAAQVSGEGRVDLVGLGQGIPDAGTDRLAGTLLWSPRRLDRPPSPVAAARWWSRASGSPRRCSARSRSFRSSAWSMWLARFASRALNSAFARSSSTGSAPGEPKPGAGGRRRASARGPGVPGLRPGPRCRVSPWSLRVREFGSLAVVCQVPASVPPAALLDRRDLKTPSARVTKYL